MVMEGWEFKRDDKIPPAGLGPPPPLPRPNWLSRHDIGNSERKHAPSEGAPGGPPLPEIEGEEQPKNQSAGGDEKNRGQSLTFPTAAEIRRRRQEHVRAVFSADGAMRQLISTLDRVNLVRASFAERDLPLIPEIQAELKQRGYEAKVVHVFQLDNPCEHMLLAEGSRQESGYCFYEPPCACRPLANKMLDISIPSNNKGCCAVS